MLAPVGVESETASEHARFIGRQESIRTKRDAGRHIDLHDAELLEDGATP
jgi:hypothetical protein